MQLSDEAGHTELQLLGGPQKPVLRDLPRALLIRKVASLALKWLLEQQEGKGPI